MCVCVCVCVCVNNYDDDGLFCAVLCEDDVRTVFVCVCVCVCVNTAVSCTVSCVHVCIFPGLQRDPCVLLACKTQKRTVTR